MPKYFNGNDIHGDCLILESYLDEMVIVSGTDRNKLRDKNERLSRKFKRH